MPHAALVDELLVKLQPRTAASIDRMIATLQEMKANLPDIKARQQDGSNSIEIDLSRLDDEAYCQALIKQLPTPGNKKYQFLYYFELLSDLPAQLAAFRGHYCEQRETLAAQGFKCAQINGERVVSRQLYVGKKLGSLRSRIKEHLGWGSKSTYAMQLRHWVPQTTPMKLELHWIRFEPMHRDLLLALEESLYDEKQPLLGQRGGR